MKLKKLNNKSIKIILLLLIFISLSLGIAYASGAFLGGSNEVSLTKGLVGHWKLDEETYDEYTENLAPFTNYSNRNYNTAYSASCWGGDLATIYHYSEGGYNNLPYKKMIKTTGGSGGCYHDNHYGIQIEDNKVYTISAWMKSNISVTVNGYALDINRASDNTYRTGPSISLTTEWKRYSWTYTSGTGHAGIYQARNIIYVDDNLPFEIYWSGFQVEEKPYTTPYVNGIRQSKVTDSTPYENHGITNSGLDVPTFTTDRLENEKGALNFDGSNNYFSTSYVKDINNRITIGAWIKPDSSGTYDISNQEQWDGGPWTGWRFRQTSSAITFKLGDGTSNSYSFSAGNLIINEWNYVVGVWNGTHIIIYINGIEAGNSPKSFIYQGNTGRHYIGKYPGSAYYYDGSIDDVRIYNRALSAEEIKSLYDSYKPQTTIGNLNKGLVAHYPLDGKYETKDITSYENHGTNNGATLTTGRKGEENGAYLFNPNNYNKILSSVKYNNYEDFSISSWIYPLSHDGSQFRIIFGNVVGNNIGSGLVIYSNKLCYHDYTTHFDMNYCPTNDYIELNKWQLVTLSYGNGNLKIYRNGIKVYENIITRTLNSNNFLIGGSYSNDYSGARFFNGSISDVRIYNRALSTEEIKLLYDSYKPQATVASSSSGLVLDMPLTSTWTKSETPGSEIITDKTPYSNHGQNYGSIIGANSISLDGVNNYVSIPNSSPLHGEVFGLTDTFTISTWAYPKAWTYWATIINKANGASWSNTLNGLWASTDYGFRCVMGSGVGGNPAGSSIGPGYNPGLNNWHHIVCVADGVNLKIYVNGIYRGESAISGLTYPRVNNNEPVTIGRRSVSSGPSFNGNISSIKAYNRALSAEEVKLLYEKGRY